MTITLEFQGFLNVKGIASGSQVELSPDTSVGDLLHHLGIEPHHQRYVISIVNQQQEAHDYVLKDNDHLFLYVPVGGG